MARRRKKKEAEVTPDDRTVDEGDETAPTEKNPEVPDGAETARDPVGDETLPDYPEGDPPPDSNIGCDERLSDDEKKWKLIALKIRPASDNAQDLRRVLDELLVEHPDDPEVTEFCERVSKKTLGEAVRAVLVELETRAKRERLESEGE
jgi:hypothetical protein